MGNVNVNHKLPDMLFLLSVWCCEVAPKGEGDDDDDDDDQNWTDKREPNSQAPLPNTNSKLHTVNLLSNKMGNTTILQVHVHGIRVQRRLTWRYPPFLGQSVLQRTCSPPIQLHFCSITCYKISQV